ncbi:DNA-binding protein [Colletotrichum karsti]|uniref:DNA-binding protein n=1 Tax=Colletotrichum karsti TaxID=1095194 RepID=A0A9P6LQX3_9PEZI|nr:DNA-binding protein [Colletotrichum karsti]KAF9881357.1 DNA-binding protein [Colletotrichum karsti]
MDPNADFSLDEVEARSYESHEDQLFQTTEVEFAEIGAPRSEELPDDDEAPDQDGRSSQKRRASAVAVEPVLKRHKGLFNNNYLDLLNEDIAEAANQIALGAEEDLPPSQLGLTFWTPFEKKLFFEALSKLGQDDICGIAGRIRTKSEIEVRQYLALLQDAVESREQDGNQGLEYSMEMENHPAAVEISLPCCHALEEAADALSFRQERHEEIVEQRRWGECWNITTELARRMEGGRGATKEPKFASQHGLGFTEVLRVKNFLQLSERIFMNASYAENNWQFVSEEPPTIRATALQDFHSLLVSVTKKVVLTTLFLAESRIRAKRKVAPSARGLVRRKDVEAAIASLGMEHSRNDFWTNCARRLRLEVWDDESESQVESTDVDEEQPLSYDEVEKVLRQKPNMTGPADTNGNLFTSGSIPRDAESSESEEDNDESASEQSDSESSVIMDEAEHEVNEEAKEVLKYSAYDFPETHRTREALRHRIRNEREQEAYADAEDARISCEAELEMWRLLQRQPPEPLVKPAPIERGRRGMKDVEDIYDVGRQWRQRLQFHSEWEMYGTSAVSAKKS